MVEVLVMSLSFVAISMFSSLNLLRISSWEFFFVTVSTSILIVDAFGNKLFINCGSVGKPKIGSPNSTYCLLDIDPLGKVTPQIRQVSYEVKKIIKDMEMLNFPSSLIRSFEEGQEY